MPSKPPKYRPFKIDRATTSNKGFNERSSEKRKERQEFYQSYPWKKFRACEKRNTRSSDEVLINQLIAKGVTSWPEVKEWFNDKRQNPLCRRCLKIDRYRSSDVLDHIKPFRPDTGMNGFDSTNIQWLCHPCHNRKSGSENRLR